MENGNSVRAKFYTFTNEIRNSRLQSVRETWGRIFTRPERCYRVTSIKSIPPWPLPRNSNFSFQHLLGNSLQLNNPIRAL